MNRPSLILASTSPIRRQMLDQAAVHYEAIAPGVDEIPIKAAHSSATDASIALAKAKAEAVSKHRPDAWVIGSDSIVTVEHRLLDKPVDRNDAAAHLRAFSGKELILTSAVALARKGTTNWSLADSATLKVRTLNDDFIERYLEAEWPEVAYCVGVFRLEGLGVTLFDSIDGNYFTILGMPLISLLGALREREMIDR